jgi:hypothetical protein
MGFKMRKILIIAIMAPCFALCNSKVYTESETSITITEATEARVDFRPFWFSMAQHDYVLAQWQLLHIRPKTLEDRMTFELSQWYLSCVTSKNEYVRVSEMDLEEELDDCIHELYIEEQRRIGKW